MDKPGQNAEQMHLTLFIITYYNVSYDVEYGSEIKPFN